MGWQTDTDTEVANATVWSLVHGIATLCAQGAPAASVANRATVDEIIDRSLDSSAGCRQSRRSYAVTKGGQRRRITRSASPLEAARELALRSVGEPSVATRIRVELVVGPQLAFGEDDVRIYNDEAIV